MSTDLELLDRWRDGDRSAGDQLFERHFDAIYRFFSNKLDAEVDELIQRTFLACVEARDRFRQSSSFRTFLFAIARNQLHKLFRERGRAGEVDFGVTSLADLEPSPRTQLAGVEQQRLLLQALRRIPLDLQIAVELHYWEELSGAELAEVLAIPEGTVRSRLRRARELLQEQIERLAAGSETRESTIADLEHWARSLKRRVEG